MITTNPILLDGKNTAFGGRIIDASLNIEFSAASSFSISVVSESGTYSIDATSLRAGGNPMVLKVGDKEFKIFPVAYTVENSEGVKTLRVEFLDSSVKYLDKKFVLLKGTHITSDNINNPDVDMSWIVPLGTAYDAIQTSDGQKLRPIGDALDENGFIKSGYGVFSPDVVVYYYLMELLNALGTLVSPETKSTVSASLKALYGNPELNEAGFVSKTCERDFIGTVREVLSSWSDDIGLIFYWEPADEKIKVFDPNDPIDSIEVATAVERMGECSCKSSSLTRSIQNNVLNGNVIIGSENVADNSGGDGSSGGRGGAATLFKMLDPWKSIRMTAYHSDYSIVPAGEGLEAAVLADAEFVSGLDKLAKASSIGEDFYMGYILSCLAWDTVSLFAGKTPAVERNPAVEHFFGEALEVEAMGVSVGGKEFNESPVPQRIFDAIKGGDVDFFRTNDPILLFKARNKIVVPAELESEDSRQKAERDSLNHLFDDTSQERVFKSLEALRHNYNRWYYSTQLITNLKFLFRKYTENVDWVYHAIGAYDTKLAQMISIRDENAGTSISDDDVTVTRVNVPFVGEARDWKRNLPPRNEIRENAEYINCADGDRIQYTGDEVEDCSHYSLGGTLNRDNILAFTWGEQSSLMAKIIKIFGENNALIGAYQSDYDSMLSLRDSRDIETNEDYGLLISDKFGGDPSRGYDFGKYTISTPIKQVSESACTETSNLAIFSTKVYYLKAGFNYESALSGLPTFLQSVSSCEEAVDMYYKKTYSFNYSYTGPAGGGGDSDEDGNDLSFYAKGVCAPKNSSQYIQNNISVQALSFLELLSISGSRVTNANGLAQIKSFASNWAKKLSINDPQPQYSQQISFVGIPESIPSIAQGLEGLSISVDENGVSTQVSVGSRKIKREIFEKRQRMISEAKYRAERSRLTLIPNGRFSTRFLAGTQL